MFYGGNTPTLLYIVCYCLQMSLFNFNLSNVFFQQFTARVQGQNFIFPNKNILNPIKLVCTYTNIYIHVCLPHTLLLSDISIDECEENDSVTVAKKILSNEDREKLQVRVAQITILRDWKRVGQLLGLGSVVEEIEYNNHDRMSSCVLEMFNKWLRKDTSFSTYEEGLLKLSTTLDMVGENALANQLKHDCGKWN